MGRSLLAGDDYDLNRLPAGSYLPADSSPTFRPISLNVIANDKIDASPVLVDRELFLRGHDYLYGIAEG